MVDEVADTVAGFDMEAALTSLVELLSTWGVRVVGAVAVLVIGMAVARVLSRWVHRGLGRTTLDATLVPFFGHIVYYAVAAFTLISVLGLFGIPTTSFVAAVGAAGLAIGLALQGSLSNLAAGVMLLIFRPFRLGDYVEANGVAGTVEEIGLFALTMTTFDNTVIVLPNASVWGTPIKNYTAKEVRRNDLFFGISYSDDINVARAAILGVLAAEPRVLKEPEPLIAVTAMGESSVDLLIGAWCLPADYWPLQFDLYQKIKEGLEAGGATIPFPQRDLHVIDMPRA
jgi:small conductance mechanosensitive channel